MHCVWCICWYSLSIIMIHDYCIGSSVEKTAMGGYTVQEHKAADCALPHPSLVLAGSGTELGLAVQVAEKIHSADPRYPTHYIYTQQ